MISTSQFRACDVCRLVDFDCTEKLCSYCGLCDAFICQDCAPQWGKRLKAAIKRKLEPGFIGNPNYTEMIRKELEQHEQRARVDN